MLKTIKIILIYSIFAVMGSFGLAKAQNYPITSQPLLTPRFSLKWTDFYTAPNFFNLQLTLKDKDKTNVQVFLKLKLERVGLVIKTREDYIPSSPINLSFGSPTMLKGTDLINYFSAENLEADGIDPAIFRQGGRLPDGFYTLTVTAFEFDATRGHRQVSNAGFTFMSNFYGYPPTITYPKEGQQLPEQVIQNTLFQWMPRATATQGGIGGLNYDFYLYELQDGDDANDIVRGKNVFFQGNTSQSSFLYGAALPQMIPGKRYAVQVRVSDIDQQNEYYNDGFSEVVSFTYGTPCVVPTDLSVSKYTAKIAKLRWTPVPNVKQYELAYKLKDASGNTWKTQTSYAYEAYATLENSVELYEFKVRSLCSNARTSDWSETVTLPSRQDLVTNNSKNLPPKKERQEPPPPPVNIDNVLNPFDIPVSSETITDDQINTRIGEIRDLRSRNKIRCGYSVSDGINCDDNAVNTNQGDDFTNAKGKYVYINGYEILVTRDAGTGNAHTGEGLLYYPLLGTRIPVAWQNASIYKATDEGEDFGCISDKVIAIGSQNGVVAADYRQQVIDLLTSGPHSWSGKLGDSFDAFANIVDEIANTPNPTPEQIAKLQSIGGVAVKALDKWLEQLAKLPNASEFKATLEAKKVELVSLLANQPPSKSQITSIKPTADYLKKVFKRAGMLEKILRAIKDAYQKGDDKVDLTAFYEKSDENAVIGTEIPIFLDKEYYPSQYFGPSYDASGRVIFNISELALSNDKLKIEGLNIQGPATDIEGIWNWLGIKKLTISDLMAIDDANPNRRAIENETLYLVRTDPPVGYSNRTVQFQWKADEDISKFIYYTDKANQTIQPCLDGGGCLVNDIWLKNYNQSLPDNAIFSIKGWGNDKYVKTQVVKYYNNETEYTQRIIGFLELLDFVQTVSDAVKPIAPCEVTITKPQNLINDKSFNFSIGTTNEEVKDSRHYVNKETTGFKLLSPTLASLKCEKKIGVSFWNIVNLELGSVAIELGLGSTVKLAYEKSTIFETNTTSEVFKPEGDLSLSLKVKGALGTKFNLGTLGSLTAQATAEIGSQAGGKLEYPYNGNAKEAAGYLYVDPIKFAVGGLFEVKNGEDVVYDKNLTFSFVLFNGTKLESPKFVVTFSPIGTRIDR